MTFELSHYRIGTGAFADVLLDTAAGQAYKLFKGPRHPSVDQYDLEIGVDRWTDFRRRVFNNELSAYELLADYPECALHAPHFGGRVPVEGVFNNGVDVADHYLLDCCFQMSLVDGAEEDTDSLQYRPDRLKEIEEATGYKLSTVLGAFHSAGIPYTKDSRLFASTGRLTLIDFSVEDPHNFEPIYG